MLLILSDNIITCFYYGMQGYACLQKKLDEGSFCNRAALGIFLQHLYLLIVSARYFVEGIIETDEYTKRNIEQSELHIPIKHSGT